MVTDALADLLLTPSSDANENLKREGIDGRRVALVGNIMIDCLEMMRDKIMRSPALSDFDMRPKDYFVLTVHRPANMEDPDFIPGLLLKLRGLAKSVRCVFPVHPRTQKRLKEAGAWDGLAGTKGVTLTAPLGYVDFMRLVFDARFVVTDSGGIQEEATYLGIPCITLRPNTERPVTITQGTNELGTLQDIDGKVDKILSGRWKKGSIPPLWDGNTAGRTLKALLAIEGA